MKTDYQLRGPHAPARVLTEPDARDLKMILEDVAALRNHADQNPDMPLLPYGRDARRSLLAKAVFTRSGVKEVSFLPMMTDHLYRPDVLRKGDARFDDLVRYMDWASEGFDHRFEVRGDEVLITASSQ